MFAFSDPSSLLRCLHAFSINDSLCGQKSLRTPELILLALLLLLVHSLSHVWLFVTTRTTEYQVPWPPLSQSAQTQVHWAEHQPAISSSAVPFSPCPQSFPASGSFPVNRFFPSGGQSTGASASASALPMNIQGWFPLGLTGWISLKSKGLSRVFSSTTVQKH